MGFVQAQNLFAQIKDVAAKRVHGRCRHVAAIVHCVNSGERILC